MTEFCAFCRAYRCESFVLKNKMGNLDSLGSQPPTTSGHSWPGPWPGVVDKVLLEHSCMDNMAAFMLQRQG